jgi:hypothetical protein
MSEFSRQILRLFQYNKHKSKKPQNVTRQMQRALMNPLLRCRIPSHSSQISTSSFSSLLHSSRPSAHIPPTFTSSRTCSTFHFFDGDRYRRQQKPFWKKVLTEARYLIPFIIAPTALLAVYFTHLEQVEGTPRKRLMLVSPDVESVSQTFEKMAKYIITH